MSMNLDAGPAGQDPGGGMATGDVECPRTAVSTKFMAQWGSGVCSS